MDPHLQAETDRLTRSWMQHEESMLREYLVSDVEDPRINVQSILTRHFLTVALFGDRFANLQEHELRFALVMNWARELAVEFAEPEELQSIAHALRVGSENADGLPIPGFVRGTAALLPAELGSSTVPDYIQSWLSGGNGRLKQIMATFQALWQHVLAGEQPKSISVLEPACGSANDYRFLEAYGLARLLAYRGFDLCEKNVENARKMFPKTEFDVGNVFEITSADQSFDHTIVHDLFEHLSIEGMERALAQVCRVTRRSLCLGFFNLQESTDHQVRPLEEYHWNALSLPLLRRLLESHGFKAQTVHIDTFLRWRFGCDRTHNKNAYTLFAERLESTRG